MFAIRRSSPPRAQYMSCFTSRQHWVQQVPQILPHQPTPERIAVTSAIENSLEHLVIVPREEQYGLSPAGYWERTAAANWGRYPCPDMTDPWVRRKNCLLGWLGVTRLNDGEARALAERCVRAEGLLSDAENFAGKIERQVQQDKPAAISTAVRFLRIPPDDAELVWFDPRTRRPRTAPIARY